MPTKVRELEPHKHEDDSSCAICHPKKDRVREDQVWGNCPTNRQHEPHSVRNSVQKSGVN